MDNHTTWPIKQNHHHHHDHHHDHHHHHHQHLTIIIMFFIISFSVLGFLKCCAPSGDVCHWVPMCANGNARYPPVQSLAQVQILCSGKDTLKHRIHWQGYTKTQGIQDSLASINTSFSNGLGGYYGNGRKCSFKKLTDLQISEPQRLFQMRG